MKKRFKWTNEILAWFLAAAVCLTGCAGSETGNTSSAVATQRETSVQVQGSETQPAEMVASGETAAALSVSGEEIPAYSGEAYVVIGDNAPSFTEEELAEAETSYETYSELDDLGRCGVCVASVGTDLMPTEERGDISSVHPSGWHSGTDPAQWNRGHLIGFQLSGENANEKNLITMTRSANEEMIPFENMVADYVKETEQHVLYRVTPVFEGDNLIAAGVRMEAESVEDAGESVLFDIFVYNVQPNVSIDYATGDSWEDASANRKTDDKTEADSDADGDEEAVYAVNDKNGKIHIIGKCSATDPDSDTYMSDYSEYASYDEAEERSKQIDSGLEKRKCGNCW